MPNPPEPISLDATTTALVLIDLQKGIVNRPSNAPRSGEQVVGSCVRLAEKFRSSGATVVLVHVGSSADGKDRLMQPTDQTAPPAPPAPPDWSQLVPEIGPKPGDVVILKRQWGAFYGTELDLQLRRRGVKTIVIAGISTNVGVESTARDAYERNYALVFVEDAMATFSAEAHQFAVGTIFPRMGRVRAVEQVLAAI